MGKKTCEDGIVLALDKIISDLKQLPLKEPSQLCFILNLEESRKEIEQGATWKDFEKRHCFSNPILDEVETFWMMHSLSQNLEEVAS